MIIEGTTSSGYHYEIDSRIQNDFRFTVLLRRMRSNDPEQTVAATVDIIELLLGVENADKLYKHVALSNEGYVPSDIVAKEIEEIVKGAFGPNTVKNSPAS